MQHVGATWWPNARNMLRSFGQPYSACCNMTQPCCMQHVASVWPWLQTTDDYILPILTTSLIRLSLKRWENVLFELAFLEGWAWNTTARETRVPVTSSRAASWRHWCDPGLTGFTGPRAAGESSSAASGERRALCLEIPDVGQR